MSGFRQSQSSLHTWSGLVVGWVLFTIFLSGTIAYWRVDLNRWMRPELGRAETPERTVAGAVAFLNRTAPDAKSWFITVPARGEAGAQVYWQPQPTIDAAQRPRGPGETQALVGADGQPIHARDTRGGEFFYRFHFDLHYMPVVWARWLVGACAMMMLVAIVSGIITHKKIFKDFFTFRRAKGQRSWLDGHNALAVLALPFHLMITYTGLVTLMTLYVPWAAVANYQDSSRLAAIVYPDAGDVKRSGRAAPLVDIAPLLRDAERRWGGAQAGSVSVVEAGDAAARITITASAANGLSARQPNIAYAGATGRPVWQYPGAAGAVQAAGVMIGLHAGRFAPDILRWFYFLSGVAGTIMVASGLVLWTVKRRERLPNPLRPHIGFRLVERLNIGVVAGMPVAMAGYLWANRLLPVDMAGRAEGEINAMFLIWAVAAVPAFLLPTKVAWQVLLGACGVMLLALPIHDLSNDRGFYRSVADGDWRMAAVSLVLLVLGAALLTIARRLWRIGHGQVPRRARRSAPAPRMAVLEPAE